MQAYPIPLCIVFSVSYQGVYTMDITGMIESGKVKKAELFNHFASMKTVIIWNAFARQGVLGNIQAIELEDGSGKSFNLRVRVAVTNHITDIHIRTID